ncbi:MAG: class I adenylate-forming enzyme family protein [Lacisediminimonas sp.]|nr:class I adenylate-forming enzyme family protein [Lacisediminimonas sp.]
MTDTVAMLDADSSYTYAELYTEIGQLAGRLRAAGVGHGDRVALATARSLQSAKAILALLAAGACPCPLEPKLGRDEVLRRVRMTGISWLLADAEHSGEAALQELPQVSSLQLESLPAAPAYWALDIAPESAGLMLFTSGSSGKPKGVLLSHRGLLANTLGVSSHTALAPQDRLLHVMPLYHTNGVNNQLFAPLLAGASVALASRFRAEDMPALVARYRPSIITGVPTMYARMLEANFSAESLENLRMLRCGSAPITEELHRKIEAKFERPLVVSYGLSEVTCTSTMNPPSARRIGSVGTVLAGQVIVLERADKTAASRPGEEGEICIGGPGLMLGYLEEDAPGTPRPVTDGVLRTGDIGRFDSEGYLYITGRIKDVIIRGGENLSPNLIESVLCEVPGVAQCSVVGGPHADLGEVPVAFVVRQRSDAGTALDASQLGDAVQKALSRIHRPTAFFFVDALPENAVGKIDKKKLVLMLQAFSPS